MRSSSSSSFPLAGRGRSARELLAEHARGGEQLALGCGQRREVCAHQILHVLRGLEVERLERPRELESPRPRLDVAPASE
jgi:hypothetical protein